MAINKVVLGTETLIDLTADTVTPSTLMQGYTAHDASGAAITGTATGGDEGSAYQDEDGYIVLGDGESSAPQGTLSITQNGTYDVADYAGASVEVSAPEPSGVKYVYSDLEDSAVDVAGYKYCSYDFAPVGDNKVRYWIELDDSDLTFTAPVNVPTYASYRYTGMIDWGDGSEQTAFAYGNTTHVHTYDSAGRYCISLWWTGGAEMFAANNVVTADKPKIIAIEAYWWNYPDNTNPTGLTNVRKIRFSSQQTSVRISGYSSLTDVVLPPSTTNITSVDRCYALEYLTIPASVTSIGGSAFANNTAMKEYHFLPTTPPSIGASPFGNNSSDYVIYVPSGSLSAYQTATNWSTYASHMQEEAS